MKACGIVAEYNPFHNGHAWHIQQARKKSGADAIVIVMSGNFVQRGEPALVDKWIRTEMALDAGADLVVELPVAYAVQPADIFARGAISILQRLQCQTVSFGVERGTATDFERAVEWYVLHKEAIDSQIKDRTSAGQTYAATMSQVLSSFEDAPGFLDHLSLPNAQLGFSYAKENDGYENPMTLVPIVRHTTQHSDTEIYDRAFASGTSIRNTLFDKTDEKWQTLKTVVPPKSYQLLKQHRHQSWADYWPYVAYQLRAQTPENLRRLYQMTEGLENRLKSSLDISQSFEEFMEKIKTKRYTWTRLQRLLVYVLLQLETGELKTAHHGSPAIRVLGFTPTGQAYLNYYKQKSDEPLVTNLNRSNSVDFQLDIRAGNIYNLGVKSRSQDFSRAPIMPFK